MPGCIYSIPGYGNFAAHYGIFNRNTLGNLIVFQNISFHPSFCDSSFKPSMTYSPISSLKSRRYPFPYTVLSSPVLFSPLFHFTARYSLLSLFNLLLYILLFSCLLSSFPFPSILQIPPVSVSVPHPGYCLYSRSSVLTRIASQLL